MASVNKFSAGAVLVIIVMGMGGVVEGELSMEYYYMTCPYAEMVVRNVVGEALWKDPTLSAGLLRLHFHDCFVKGCDASVLLDSTPDTKAEKDAPANRSLRGFEVIDAIKDALEEQCPGIVSCADILALAARDSVYMAGGPYYEVPTGRMDGFRSDAADTVALPAGTLSAPELIKLFASHGLSMPEMVALSGGHTLGVAHCASFKSRLGLSSNDIVDPLLDEGLAASLAGTCGSGGDGATATFDETSQVFDTAYFTGLQQSRGLLVSDQTLVAGSPETEEVVNTFAASEDMFFYNFKQGMLKMGQIDLKLDGDVRKSCRLVN